MRNMLGILAYIVIAASSWRMFQKMGRKGWEGIIPFYDLYVLFEELYGNGWKMLLFLVPFYNIYLAVKFNIDLAHIFHAGTGFGWGLLFLPYVFYPLLGFGSYVYADGSHVRYSDDPISVALDRIAGVPHDSTFRAGNQQPDSRPFEQIRELADLRDRGIITEEEFQRKKDEILRRV